MKRGISVCLLSVILAISVFAQKPGEITNGFNLQNFPEVSFVYHSYNPEVLKKSNFWYLKETGKNREFSVEKLPQDYDNLPQTTLILWEDMGYAGYEQYYFTKEVLSDFFSRADIPSSDQFAIYAFNRRKNTSSSLINLTNGFTSDISSIVAAIRRYEHSTELYAEFPNRSDMYTSIREGLDLLAPIKDSKAIVVFTAGYSMKNSGADSEAQVLFKAQQLHIPVYIFQYYYKSGVTPEPEGFAKATFGTFGSYKDADTAERALIDLYPKISKRYQGHDYKVSFSSEAERGSEVRMITLSVDGVEVQEQLLPPSHTFLTWVESHLWLVGVLTLSLILLIVGVLLYIRKTQKSAKENRQELANLERRRLQDKEDADRRQLEIEQRAQREKNEQERRKEESRLWDIMKVKNLYPRLKCCLGSDSFIHEIDKPSISIGRDNDNDLVLNDRTVSRRHAEIVFNGSGFVINDKGSTNKVIVNGRIVESTELKTGDIIGLGEVVLTFYL